MAKGGGVQFRLPSIFMRLTHSHISTHYHRPEHLLFLLFKIKEKNSKQFKKLPLMI